MSKQSIKAKIEFILEMVDNIKKIIQRHNGIINSLNDFEPQMAILMALAQIGETLNKIDDEVLEKFDLLNDKKGAYSVRNFIVHDYEGVNLAYVENILREYLPILEIKVKKLDDYIT